MKLMPSRSSVLAGNYHSKKKRDCSQRNPVFIDPERRFSMSLRAAMYPRVSTDIQRDNYSIPSQIKDMLEYARVHEYVLVGDRFVDPVTGKDTEKVNGAIPAFVDDYTSTELSRPGLN